MLDTRWALKNVYKVDGNGVIECGTVTQLPKLGILRCSDCNEPSRSTTRYELANQLQDLTTTIEHFYSKIGNKLSELHEDYLHSEEVLCLTFRGFTETLKPGPLGGKHNQRAIWVRGNTMLEIQDRATKFRDDVVTPFESNLARLAEFVKNTDILEHIASPFGVRYDLVYFQCRLVSLEDALQMYQHLLKLKAADQHTSIIAQGLRIMIHKQAAGEVVSLGRKIIASQDLHLKRIEVELKIIQVSLHLILKELHVVSGLSVSTCMNDIRELVEGFPDTAGKLLRTFISLQTHVDHGTIPARFARLYTEDTKELGAQFKQHQMGTVQYCLHKHPFSGSMFADCPECGREVAPPIQQPEVNAHKVLDPQAFLDFFKNRGPPTWSKEKGLTWT
ncbi:hypothetical protein MMC26_001913 [Xylographa opegraphella]|nr:hypothetical protein [Xylographa opegraphella]